MATSQARLFMGPPWSPINGVDPVIYLKKKDLLAFIPKMLVNLFCTLFFMVMGALYV